MSAVAERSSELLSEGLPLRQTPGQAWSPVFGADGLEQFKPACQRPWEVKLGRSTPGCVLPTHPREAGLAACGVAEPAGLSPDTLTLKPSVHRGCPHPHLIALRGKR